MITMLFSGRFDKPHIGHAITIGRLGQQWDNVIVVVLDYEKAAFPLLERMTTLSNMLMLMNGNYQLMSSKHHFGEITKEQLRGYPTFEVYGTGNETVYEHMSNLGAKMNFHTIKVPRYPEYAASDDKKFNEIKKIMEKN